MIKLQDIRKFYKTGDTHINALDGISMDIEKGKLTVVLGPSGSGKSTLLNILGGIDLPSSGALFIEGNKLEKKDLEEYRKSTVGFVFQFYNLISNLSVLENVSIAEKLVSKKESDAELLLDRVGLKHRKNNFPDQLSGGEMQRVAIARALSKVPSLLLCDEPTGALDSKTSRNIFELLRASCNEETAVVIVTHNDKVVQIADKIIKLRDGKVQETIINESPLKVSEVNWE